MDKSIIVIGAGIAGLSAGCYGQMNGYRTQIFELHDKPGGVCTAWKRKGYTFDGCIHWLGGSAPGNIVHTIWEELGAVQGRRMINHEVFKQIVIGDRSLRIYTNLDRFEQALKGVSPRDGQVIEGLVREVRRFSTFSPPWDKPGLGLADVLRMLPYAHSLFKYQKISTEEFAAHFRDPFLRQVFLAIFPLPDMPMFLAILNLAIICCGNAGYPEGGSLEFARAIERRYLGLGGQIHYNSRVSEILVENGCAVGVRLADGGEHRADWVISAADGHSTLFEMLPGKYVGTTVRRYYEELPLWKPLVYICLGVNRDLSQEPPIVMVHLEPPVTIADEKYEWISWFNYGYDSTLAPAGKSVVISMQETNFEFWEEVYADRSRYEVEKQKVTETLVAELEKYYPGIRPQIEVTDVATPMTWVRYTGNWRGAYQGWLPTRKAFGTRMKKALPGLDNFCMCGQWVEPGGGVPTAAASGRQVIQVICKRDKKRFVTTVEKLRRQIEDSRYM